MHVFIKKEQNEIDMEKTIRQKIYDLLDIINGYFDKRGWPLGRNVYESEIYRLIEDIDGVENELASVLQDGDVLLTLGAGSIGRVASELPQKLQEAA